MGNDLPSSTGTRSVPRPLKRIQNKQFGGKTQSSYAGEVGGYLPET